MEKTVSKIVYDGESIRAECPYCDDWLEFDRDGKVVNLDCPHLIDSDGETATFADGMTGDLWDFHHGLMTKPMIEPTSGRVYAIGCGKSGFYVRQTTNGKQGAYYSGFKTKQAAAWWCVEDVLRLRGELV